MPLDLKKVTHTNQEADPSCERHDQTSGSGACATCTRILSQSDQIHEPRKRIVGGHSPPNVAPHQSAKCKPYEARNMRTPERQTPCTALRAVFTIGRERDCSQARGVIYGVSSRRSSWAESHLQWAFGWTLRFPVQSGPSQQSGPESRLGEVCQMSLARAQGGPFVRTRSVISIGRFK